MSQYTHNSFISSFRDTTPCRILLSDILSNTPSLVTISVQLSLSVLLRHYTSKTSILLITVVIYLYKILYMHIVYLYIIRRGNSVAALLVDQLTATERRRINTATTREIVSK